MVELAHLGIKTCQHHEALGHFQETGLTPHNTELGICGVAAPKTWKRPQTQIWSHRRTDRRGLVSLKEMPGQTSLGARPLTEWKWAGCFEQNIHPITSLHIWAHYHKGALVNAKHFFFFLSLFYISLELWWVLAICSVSGDTFCWGWEAALCDCKVWPSLTPRPQRVVSE